MTAEPISLRTRILQAARLPIDYGFPAVDDIAITAAREALLAAKECIPSGSAGYVNGFGKGLAQGHENARDVIDQLLADLGGS